MSQVADVFSLFIPHAGINVLWLSHQHFPKDGSLKEKNRQSLAVHGIHDMISHCVFIMVLRILSIMISINAHK